MVSLPHLLLTKICAKNTDANAAQVIEQIAMSRVSKALRTVTWLGQLVVFHLSLLFNDV